MTNNDMKKLIKESRLFHYEIAEEIGITDVKFSQWFRKDLTIEQQNKIISVIKNLERCE